MDFVVGSSCKAVKSAASLSIVAFLSAGLVALYRFATFFVDAVFFALNAAQRFFVASAIALRPAVLNFRFFGADFDDTACDSWYTAQRFLWAAAIFRRAAALIVHLRGFAF
jgi:hypothetical protein